mgnify:CR=1 FL=1
MKKTLDIKKLILLNMPYILLGLFATNFGEAWRMAQGADASEKFLSLVAVLPGALQSFWPSLHPLDLLVGLCCGGSLRLAVYRHMKLLTESGILTVVGENRIRGTVESIYSLNKSALEIDDDGTAVQTALLGLSASFARYFSGGGADPRRDMLLMTTCTLTLTDEEFTGFLTEINQTALKYMDIGVKEESRQRQITLISSPTDGPGSR